MTFDEHFFGKDKPMKQMDLRTHSFYLYFESLKMSRHIG